MSGRQDARGWSGVCLCVCVRVYLRGRHPAPRLRHPLPSAPPLFVSPCLRHLLSQALFPPLPGGGAAQGASTCGRPRGDPALGPGWGSARRSLALLACAPQRNLLRAATGTAGSASRRIPGCAWCCRVAVSCARPWSCWSGVIVVRGGRGAASPRSAVWLHSYGRAAFSLQVGK